MANIRATWRVFLLALWTLGMFCLLLLLRFFTKRWFIHIDLRLRSGLVRLWARVALRMGGVRLRVHGVPPPHPCFTVSNHLSSIDSVVVCAVMGGIFVARHDMAQWPLIGFMTRSIDIIFVNRLRRTDVGDINQRIAEALDRGYAVHMFAESRIGDGKTVLPFKPALLQPAVQADIPVHYATVSYRTKPGDPSPMQAIHWGPDESFTKHLLDILRLHGAEATIVFGDEAIAGTDRKQLAYALWEKVKAKFTPLE
ncbi:MAG: lysophospholipid acyltransferase family protein [Candidatus Hydrogenedentota bacterium]